MRLILILTMVVAMWPLGAAAQAVGGREAARQLFPVRGIGVAVSSELDPSQQAVVRAMAAAAEQQGQSFRYYGAIAFSPGAGLQSSSLQGAFNFHGIDAAEGAALAACEAEKEPGAGPCLVAGRILPRGWEARPLQLSFDATNAFRQVYGRGGGSRALAISDATGAWAIGRGGDAEDEALASCNRDALARGRLSDCRIAVAD